MQKNVWNDICEHLKILLPQHIYHSYVERVTASPVDDEKIDLSFQDAFTKENFETKCLPTIRVLQKKLELEALEFTFSVLPPPQNQIEIPQYTVSNSFEHAFLDTIYTLDTFVVGGSNQFAHAACQAVARQPGQCYNPLFIFGGAGLGKTHLLKAVGYEILLLDRNMRVRFVTTETFTNELIQAIRTDSMREFREKFRAGCDVLLLDDVHFLAGKERTQEEFFYTFNFLHESRKQIVITSDRYPKDIQGLENRLQTRFQWGLVADVQPPETETRIAILKNKAEQVQIELPDDVAQYIASQVTNNIRELEGALHRLQAYASLTSTAICLQLAQNIFKDISPRPKHELTADAILKLVALHFNVRTTDLKSEKRVRKLTFPRQICMYLLRKHLLMSFPAIGRFMGGRDHTTALHAVTKIAELLRRDMDVLKDVTAVEGLIR